MEAYLHYLAFINNDMMTHSFLLIDNLGTKYNLTTARYFDIWFYAEIIWLIQ